MLFNFNLMILIIYNILMEYASEFAKFVKTYAFIIRSLIFSNFYLG